MLAMEEDPQVTGAPQPYPTQHLATIGHEGRFWEVYMELEDDPSRDTSCRGRLRFDAADTNEGEPVVRTATIIIEPSYEEAMRKARSFPDHQLVALLRLALPDA